MSGRAATTSIIPGRYAISVGDASMPAPHGWSWILLSEVARLETGHTPSRSHAEYWEDGDIAWIGIKDARLHHGKRIFQTLQKVTQAGIDNSASRKLPAGTVCLSRTASVGYVLVMGREMATSQDFVNWVCSDALVPEFLMYALMAEGEDIRRFGKGTTHTTIYFPEVKAFHVCLPPVEEQRRIVTKIEELFSDLDAGVAALTRAKANLKRYRASVLKAAVEGHLTAAWRAEHPGTEPASALLARILTARRQEWEADQLAKFTAAGKSPPKNWKDKYVEPSPPDTTNLPELPKGWCWARIHHMAFVDVGFAFKSAEFVDDGIRLLRGENMEPGKLRWRDVRYWPNEKLAGLEQLLVREGQIILAMDRPLVSAGLKIARARANDLPCLLVQRMSRLRMIDEVHTEYLYYSMQTHRFITHLLGDQTGTQLPHISGSGIEEFVFPLPPLAEQRQIVAEVAERLSQADASESAIEHSLLRASRLRQSILKQAFEGKLVPQDPADEPASVLLERILEAPPAAAIGNGKMAGKRARRAQAT